jgi:hypothetical protein
MFNRKDKEVRKSKGCELIKKIEVKEPLKA